MTRAILAGKLLTCDASARESGGFAAPGGVSSKLHRLLIEATAIGDAGPAFELYTVDERLFNTKFMPAAMAALVF